MGQQNEFGRDSRLNGLGRGRRCEERDQFALQVGSLTRFETTILSTWLSLKGDSNENHPRRLGQPLRKAVDVDGRRRGSGESASLTPIPLAFGHRFEAAGHCESRDDQRGDQELGRGKRFGGLRQVREIREHVVNTWVYFNSTHGLDLPQLSHQIRTHPTSRLLHESTRQQRQSNRGLLAILGRRGPRRR